MVGKTGDYPRGKLKDDDEGGLEIAVATIDKTVIINFGHLVSWIGMDKQCAINLANTLLEKASSI